MKTSHILLAIIAVVTLTGMVATDVLLKRQYDKINWSDPYQTFDRREVPTVTHWVIEGAPTDEVIVEQSTGKAQALIQPERAKFFRVREQGDTAYVTFTPDYDGPHEPKNDAYNALGAGLVLRLPDLQSLRIRNGRLTVLKRTATTLAIELDNTRLRTNYLTVSGPMILTGSRNSFAVLGTDRYQSLRLTVRDSSGVQLNDTQTEQFTSDVSLKAEVQLRGQALRWLAK
ncbi:hypothetical protein [Spirosoma arcticum]